MILLLTLQCQLLPMQKELLLLLQQQLLLLLLQETVPLQQLTLPWRCGVEDDAAAVSLVVAAWAVLLLLLLVLLQHFLPLYRCLACVWLLLLLLLFGCLRRHPLAIFLAVPNQRYPGGGANIAVLFPAAAAAAAAAGNRSARNDARSLPLKGGHSAVSAQQLRGSKAFLPLLLLLRLLLLLLRSLLLPPILLRWCGSWLEVKASEGPKQAEAVEGR